MYIVYRRSEKELPARAEEVEHAKEEGIIFKTLTNPTEIRRRNSGIPYTSTPPARCRASNTVTS